MKRYAMACAVLAALGLLAAGASAKGYQNKANERSKEPPALEATKAVLDVNSASKDELKSLPGIGEEYADRIIKNRPYKTKQDLERRQVLPKSVYEKIGSRITTKKSQSRPVESQPTK